MRLALILPLLLLTGCLSAEDYNRAPWDTFGCTYNPDGTVADYPCIDNRYGADVDVWQSLDTSKLKVYRRVSDTFEACGGQYACTIGGTVHITAGDVGAMIKIAQEAIQ